MYRDGSYGFAAPMCSNLSGTVAMALPRQSCADVSADDIYGCAAPKLCGRIGDDSYGYATPKLFGRIETVAKASRCQSSALSSEQARRLRLRLAQIVKR